MSLAGDIESLSESDRDVYAKAAEAAGKNPLVHVRLALWCEAHDLEPERLKHLTLAVEHDPSSLPARGLLGMVAYQDRWGRPEEIAQQIRDDAAGKALIAEYLERRAVTPEKADALLKLAAWCAERGLRDEAAVHYRGVLDLDPTREIAWRQLGFKKQGNRWVKPEEVATARQNQSLQKQADRSWKTRLEKLRDGLQSKDAAKRAKAEQEFAAVTDPRAVPMIWAIFVRGGARLQSAAVQLLGQIDGPSASNGLAALAVFSPVADVRFRATQALKRRDPRDVVGRLIAMIHKTYKYEVRPARNPGSAGELIVEGEKFTGRWLYNTAMNPALMSSGGLGRFYTAAVPFDPFSLQNMVAVSLGAEYAHLKNQFGQITAPGGMQAEFPITISPQISPASAAQAARAMAANPQNAAAILNRLTTDPANQTLPPLMWYLLANQHVILNNLIPSHIPGIPPIEHFLPADVHGAVNPMQAAMGLYHRDQVAMSPANFSANLAYEIMIETQGIAAKQDMDIARDILAIRQAKLNMERKLAMDVQIIETMNGGIKMTNERVLPVLSAITGVDFGAERDRWKSWWTAQLGYRSGESLSSTNRSGARSDAATLVSSSVACLAASTLIQTLDGARPIEKINVGDRVLAQDTTSGKLAFQPVIATHSGLLAHTLKVRVGGESIAATGLLRFWKVGKGWTMARDLNVGDRLRVAGNSVVVESVERDANRTVYNLDVAECRNILVGASKFLVHDFGTVQPVLEPFDRAAELKLAKGSAQATAIIH